MNTVLLVMVGLFVSLGVSAQQMTVKGTVTDVQGEPIIGANIIAEKSAVGTISDLMVILLSKLIKEMF